MFIFSMVHYCTLFWIDHAKLLIHSRKYCYSNHCTNEVIWRFWDGKIPPRAASPLVEEFWNSLWVTKGTSQFLCKSQFFPMNGLAGVVKKNPPRAAKPRVEDFFFTTTAKPWMGKNCDAHRIWNVPWVTNREFFPYQNCQMIALAFLLC